MARPRRTEPVTDNEDAARRDRWRWWFAAVRKAAGAPDGVALYAALESENGETADEVLVRFGLLDTFENFFRVKTGACEVSRQLCEGSLSGPLDYGRPIPRPPAAIGATEALSAGPGGDGGTEVGLGAEDDQGEVVRLGVLDVEINQVEQEQKRRLVVAEAEAITPNERTL